MYICERCGYSTTIKCNMKSHLSRKKICPEIYSNKDVLGGEGTKFINPLTNPHKPSQIPHKSLTINVTIVIKCLHE